jgi:hypothetical protein
MSIFKKKPGLASAISQYTEDTLNLKTLTDAVDELLKDPKKYSLSEKATDDKQFSVILKGHEFFTDKESKEGIEKAGMTHDKIVALMRKIDKEDPFAKRRA